MTSSDRFFNRITFDQRCNFITEKLMVDITQPARIGRFKVRPDSLLWQSQLFLIEILPAVLAAVAFAPTLFGASFIRDDWYFIVHNPLLRGPAGLLQIWTTGYVEAVFGSAARVSEYRPLTMLSFYFDSIVFGKSPGLMHVTNIALHAANCTLLLRKLRQLIDRKVAWMAAIIFAVMPIHAEAVAGLVNRTELFVLFWILSSWILLEGDPAPRQIALGTAAYGLALLSKEHAILFPAVMALGDAAFYKRSPWHKTRWKAYLSLITTTGFYLWIRARILTHQFQGGIPYFSASSRIIQALTVARFWVFHYAWPTLSGLGLCNDFSRPWIPDSGYSDVLAWACLAAILAAIVVAGREWYYGGRQNAFWILLPFLFLLPTSHLLFPLDTLGAQRFLYLPSISVAVALAYFFHRLRKSHRWFSPILLSLYLALGLVQSRDRSGVWASDLAYYQDATTQNPVSPGARVGLSMALLERGDRAGAIRESRKALGTAPAFFSPYYNLGKMAWEEGDYSEAEDYFNKAHIINPDDASTLDFLALLAEKKGHPAQAEKFYLSAFKAFPNDSVALYNLGSLYWREGRFTRCRRFWGRFLRMFPKDPESPRIRVLLAYQDVKKGKPRGSR